jgi:hypothetical protein
VTSQCNRRVVIVQAVSRSESVNSVIVGIRDVEIGRLTCAVVQAVQLSELIVCVMTTASVVTTGGHKLCGIVKSS